MVFVLDLNKLISQISDHLGKRDDFYYIVSGPKREVWFNAEIISVLNRRQPDSFADGLVYFGEQSYKKLLKMQGSNAPKNNELNRIPDITGYSFDENTLKIIIEAKLIDSVDIKKNLR